MTLYYLWYRGLNFFNFGDITKILWYCWFFYFEETFRSECRERNERRGAQSVAEAGVPFRGGRSGGRSEPERLKRNGANEENVWGIRKTSKKIITFPDMEKHKKKTFQHIQWYPILALIFCPFLTNFDANFSKLHLCVILKVSQKTLKIDKKSLLNPMDFTIFDP